jgi:hypothetical protein
MSMRCDSMGRVAGTNFYGPVVRRSKSTANSQDRLLGVIDSRLRPGHDNDAIFPSGNVVVKVFR